MSKKLDFNTQFFMDMMTGIVMNMNKRFKSEFYVQYYNTQVCDDYIDGILWFMDMYYDGTCKQYDYIYNHKITPHCLGLYLQISGRKKLIRPKTNDSEPIPSDLYSIILMPKRAKKMLDSRYYDLMDTEEFKILYNDEHCNDCDTIVGKIRDLEQKEMKMSGSSGGSKSEAIRNQIVNEKNNLKLHRERHAPLTSKKIYKIKKSFEEYTESELNSD